MTSLIERTVATGEVVLNYAEGPNAGPPFLLVHGGSARWQYGEALLRALSERWHVYGLDLRGHGTSGWTPGRYRLRDHAADVAAFVEMVIGQPALVYGHSLGGEAAIMAAARSPELFRALIVGDSPLPSDTSPLETSAHRTMLTYWRDLATAKPGVAEIEAALREMPIDTAGVDAPRRAGDAFGETNPWFAFMAESLQRLDPSTLTMLLDDRAAVMAGYDTDLLFPAVTCPVLLLQADPGAGGLMGDADVARALSVLPRGVHRRLDGFGHPLHGVDVHAVLTAISDFVQDIDALPPET